MSSTGVSTFDAPQPFSTRSEQDPSLAAEDKDQPCDFVTVLGVAQTLGVGFLPISWRPQEGDIGFGGIGQISQSIVDVETSLAFKRISSRHKGEGSEEKAFREFITEMNILHQRPIRSHPGIVELQGVCWELSPKKESKSLNQQKDYISPLDGKVWPVLVFEKSQLGDLYYFLTHASGRTLKIAERYEICIQIGNTISFMHSHRIVHGDLKPENVLIFPEDTGRYRAKVHDFGCSSYSSSEKDLIRNVRSRPWNAPEGAFSEVFLADALKRDVFSFGMLFLWVLFEKTLSGNAALPEELDWVGDLPRGVEHHDPAKNLLEDLKRERKLGLFARILLEKENGLSRDLTQRLQDLFEKSLAEDPSLRGSDLVGLFDQLKATQNTCEINIAQLQPLVYGADFHIIPSFTSLYQASHRVRSYVLKSLESRIHGRESRSSGDSNILFQLAICYTVGFGGPRDAGKAMMLLEQSNHTASQLEDSIDRIRGLTTLAKGGSIFESLTSIGHVPLIEFSEYYKEQNDLEDATKEIDREILDLEAVIGSKPLVVSLLKEMKAEILKTSGKWKEAEELLSEHIAVSSNVSGRDHPATQTFLAELATVYHYQGRLKEAYDIEVEVLEVRRRDLGAMHPATITSLVNLGATYQAMGEWEKAESTEKEAFEAREKTLGPNHPATLSSLANMAVTIWHLGHWDKARIMSEQALRAQKIVLGADHPRTLSTMSTCASAYQSLGQLQQAEDLEVEALSLKEKTLGPDHPATLESMYNLALIYQSRGQWKQAEELTIKTLEFRKRLLGELHPNTWHSMGSLASIYLHQGHWDKAGALYQEVADLQCSKLGEKHPQTLNTLSDLAVVYYRQKQWEKAVDLRLKVTEWQEELVGPDHPSTLTSKSNLATIYYELDRWNEAEKLQMEIVKSWKEQVGETHPNTMICIANLATTYRKLGRHQESEKLQLQVLDNRKRLLGEHHQDTIIGMQNLAFTLQDLNRAPEALDMLSRSVQLANENIGPEHPITLSGERVLKSWRETYRP